MFNQRPAGPEGGLIYVGANTSISGQVDNAGDIEIGNASTLTAKSFSQSASNAVTTISTAGRLRAPDVYFTGGTITGTVTLAGTNFNGTRRLTIGSGGLGGNTTFAFPEGGELASAAGSGATVPAGNTLIAQTSAVRPEVELKLLTGSSTFGSAYNNGTITLSSDATIANSAVTLSVADNTAGSYGRLNNSGTINLLAGATGTNTRTINGSVSNMNAGTINIAPGVAARITALADNAGALTIPAGASLTTAAFSQSSTGASTTVNGTLSSPDIYFGGGALSGTFNLAGSNGLGTRTLTLGGSTTGTPTFEFADNGGQIKSAFGSGAIVPVGITVLSRATSASPSPELKLLTNSTSGFAINNGTITLDAAADASNSVVTLSPVNTSPGTYGSLYNRGTINLNAGGAGTNTRLVQGMLINEAAGVINVNAPTTVGLIDNFGTLTLKDTLTVSSQITNRPSGVLNINATPNFVGTFNNQGTINLTTPTPPSPEPGQPTPPPATVEVPYAIGGSGGITQSGAGTTVLSGDNTYTGTTVVSNDAGVLRATPAAYENVLSNAGGLDVKSGTFIFDYGAAAGRGPVTNAVAVSPISRVKQMLTDGYASGFTAGQIRSTGLAGNETLGYGDTGTSVVVRVVLPGDGNLDGVVNFNDFLILQANFGVSGTRFDQGNSNYDAVTNFNDFLLLQANFGQSVSSAAVAMTADETRALTAFAAANAHVPEPAALGVFGAAATAALMRRRRA